MKCFKLKNCLLFLFAFFISTASFAQQGINYKAVIKDDLGNVIASQEIDVRFSIIEDNGTTTTVIYTEDHDNIMTDANGVVILNIGEGTAQDDFSNIDWGSDSHALQTEIDLEDDGTFENLGTTEFKTVPYAKVAENVSGLEAIDQGNGNGWRLIDVNPDHYVPIGNNAVDLSFSNGNPTETGAFGNNSFAMGVNTEASGYASFAMGYYAEASGEVSTAMGNNTEASGDYSTAIGNSTIASTTNSLAVGSFNIDVPNTKFVIGNGISLSNRSNAFVVLHNGTITAPSFNITEITDDKALITKEYLDANSAQSINDLTDGKSDDDGLQNGSSVFIGVNSGLADDGTNNRNVGVGFETLKANTFGYNNAAYGHSALIANTEGHSNTALGANALLANTTGVKNTTVGTNSLTANISGSSNTAIGFESLRLNTSGGRNNAIGYFALRNNTTGYNNTANGYRALENNTEGGANIAVGVSALFANTTGSNNVAVGREALKENTTGSNNIAIGHNALQNFQEHTGSNNIGIGFSAQVASPALSNQVRIGNPNISYAGIQVNWSITSDKRWKDNIRKLPYGLDMVMQLQPVDYIRKNNDKQTREMGFIAQDLEALLEKVGYTDQSFLTKDDKGYLSVRYNDFIALLTKALQEQQGIIETLSKDKSTLENTVTNLIARVEKMEANN